MAGSPDDARGAAASWCPQLLQNFESGGFSCLQLRHVAGSCVPHWLQNFAVSGFVYPQVGQLNLYSLAWTCCASIS
jgi:hypothetical protein